VVGIQVNAGDTVQPGVDLAPYNISGLTDAASSLNAAGAINMAG